MSEEMKTTAKARENMRQAILHDGEVTCQIDWFLNLLDDFSTLERQLAEEQEKSKAWQEFRQLVQLHYACPPDISADFIRAIMAVLKEER